MGMGDENIAAPELESLRDSVEHDRQRRVLEKQAKALKKNPQGEAV